MGQTPNYQIPYPGLADPPNVPLHAQRLAEAVDTSIKTVEDTTGTLDTRVGALSSRADDLQSQVTMNKGELDGFGVFTFAPSSPITSPAAWVDIGFTATVTAKGCRLSGGRIVLDLPGVWELTVIARFKAQIGGGETGLGYLSLGSSGGGMDGPWNGTLLGKTASLGLQVTTGGPVTAGEMCVIRHSSGEGTQGRLDYVRAVVARYGRTPQGTPEGTP
jgi:hypothetical protein